MDCTGRKLTPQIKEGHRRKEGDEVVDGEGVVRESDSLRVEGILGASGSEQISSYGDGKKDPHTEEGHPGEELN